LFDELTLLLISAHDHLACEKAAIVLDVQAQSSSHESSDLLVLGITCSICYDIADDSSIHRGTIYLTSPTYIASADGAWLGYRGKGCRRWGGGH